MEFESDFEIKIIENSYKNKQGLNVVYSNTPENIVQEFKDFNADYKKIYGTNYFIFEQD